MTTISAVLPCFNAAPFLAEAIASVRAQRRPVSEIIVVDDCSTDDSAAIAAALGAVVVRLERNSGPAAARNAGLRAASGDYVAWLDADDYWLADHVAAVTALLDRHEQVAVAFGLVRQFGAGSDAWPALLPEDAPVDAWAAAFRRCLLPHNAVVVRRHAVLAAGGYDESLRLAEDYDLWVRLAWRHPFACTHAVTAMWRRHASNTSGDPFAYWKSEYVSRRQFVDGVAGGDIPPWSWARRYSIDDVRAAATSVWAEHVAASWYSRSPDRLLFHLDMGRAVGAPATTIVRWRVKRRFLWLALARERLRAYATGVPPRRDQA